MLSWVIGSRSMLSPRILLALFVRHLSPFYNIRFIKNHSIKLDLQFCHVLCVEPRHHFLRERRVNRSNPRTNFYKCQPLQSWDQLLQKHCSHILCQLYSPLEKEKRHTWKNSQNVLPFKSRASIINFSTPT